MDVEKVNFSDLNRKYGFNCVSVPEMLILSQKITVQIYWAIRRGHPLGAVASLADEGGGFGLFCCSRRFWVLYAGLRASATPT